MKNKNIGVNTPKINLQKKPIVKLVTALIFVTLSQVSVAQISDSISTDVGLDRILYYNSATAISNQYIIVFKDNYVDQQVQSLMVIRGQFTERQAREHIVNDMSIDLATQGLGDIQRTYSAALNGFVLVSRSAKAVARLALDSRVDFIEADQTVSVGVTQNNATWGLDRIDQVNLPLNNTYIYNQNGSGVTAYIIDTGVRQTHNLFGGRASGGFTSINDGNGTSDCNGHGTHVAGTVGSSTYGVAKNVNIVAVRVLGCNGSGSNSGVVAGIDWVTANHTNTSVANMSLGGDISSATDNAVNAAVASGITMVVAAGNDNANACGFSPARATNAITVGSTTSSDSRSSFSNFGTCLDIFAPGSSITSTWSTSNSATNTISGTSMASPHVAGVAALYLDDNPNASPAQVQAAIESAAGVNKVSNPRSGSPNLLLNSNLGSGNPPPPSGGSFFQNTSNISIPDNNPTGATSNLNVSRTGASGNIRVTYSIVHTYIGDLKVEIFTPTGQTAVLRNGIGGSANNINETKNLNAGSIEASGNWRLKVTDDAGQDTGFIDSWSIEFL